MTQVFKLELFSLQFRQKCAYKAESQILSCWFKKAIRFIYCAEININSQFIDTNAQLTCFCIDKFASLAKCTLMGNSAFGLFGTWCKHFSNISRVYYPHFRSLHQLNITRRKARMLQTTCNYKVKNQKFYFRFPCSDRPHCFTM